MTASIRTRPTPSRFERGATSAREAYLLIRHLSGTLIKELATELEPSGVTPEQYHVLRILRDAPTEGLACSAVAQRTVSGDPDVTRLLDRLEARGLATRVRDTTDRRVVMATITKEGLRLLGRIEEKVSALHARQFADLGSRELTALRGLLDRVAPQG